MYTFEIFAKIEQIAIDATINPMVKMIRIQELSLMGMQKAQEELDQREKAMLSLAGEVAGIVDDLNKL